MDWIQVSERYPAPEGEQVNVLFCSPGWGWAIVGMFELQDGKPIWDEYDQIKDRYTEWTGPAPTLWMYRPEPPEGE